MQQVTRPPELRLFEGELIVDLFAGGGGASKGIERALGRSPDIAINHDKEAISIHQANHPDTQHYIENVWRVEPKEVCAGRRVRLMWLSPDCKHFSKAKGGKPRDKKIRSLAWVAVHWAQEVRPDVICLENVEEFQKWGPLLEDGTPCPARIGTTFRRFVKRLENLGYQVEYRELVAADYGAPTSRKRLFLVARCDGQPIVWPQATHGEGRIPHRQAAECIDWSIPCPSIFERAKPLAENTERRIARGIEKFVKHDPYIVPMTDVVGVERQVDVSRAALAAVKKTAAFLAGIDNKSSGASSAWSARQPLKTITLENRHALVAPFLKPRYGEDPDPKRNGGRGQEPRSRSIARPMPTIVPTGNGGDLVATFLAKHNAGHEATGQRLEAPVAAITGRDNKALVASSLVKLYGTCQHGQPMRQPLATISAQGNHFAEVRAFLMKYHRDGGQLAKLQAPMPTIVATDSLALVTVEGQEYAIVDIGMRMLQPRELFRAHDFPDDYVIDRGAHGEPMTKEAQVRMVGNSVPPPMAEAIVRAQFGLQHQAQEKAAA